MSHFKAKIHRIRFLVSVGLRLRWSLTLSTHTPLVLLQWRRSILASEDRSYDW